MDIRPPGSSVLGILQARMLEWVASPPPGALPDPGIQHSYLTSPALAGGFFTGKPLHLTGEPKGVWREKQLLF